MLPLSLLPGDSMRTVKLPAVRIEATRTTESEAWAARSVFVQVRERVALDPSLSLQHALRGMPGIQIQDRGHYALGERLLIRGMGYRSAFGVRGVQVLLDGIPLTVADGAINVGHHRAVCHRTGGASAGPLFPLLGQQQWRRAVSHNTVGFDCCPPTHHARWTRIVPVGEQLSSTCQCDPDPCLRLRCAKSRMAHS